MADELIKAKQDVGFFDAVSKDLAPISEEEKKALAEFRKEGVKEEAKGLPMVAPQIEILHQGACAFKFVEASDDDQLQKSFEAILLHVEPQRAWWKTSIGEKKDGGDKSTTGQMPDCWSRDLVVPDPQSAEKQSERCDTCKFNEFGSDRKNGRGKDCKEVRRLFVMPVGKLDPHVINTPPSSLKSLKKYFTFLQEKGLGRPQFVLTKFSLKTVPNKDGVDYSELQLTYVKALPENVAFMAMTSKKALEEMLRSARPITSAEYAPEPGSAG
jgi:hypothetical protein